MVSVKSLWMGLFACGKKSCRGYSMLELLLASAVGSIVLAGSYTSYVIIAQQYSRLSSFSEVQGAGTPTLQLLHRDLRMAGHVALDETTLDSVYGAIATPIAITDSGDACCDSIIIIYDKASTVNPKRCQITYSTQANINPTRNTLVMQVTTLSSDVGDLCTGDGVTSTVVDYVEDLQFVGSDNDTNGNPMLVDVALILRSQSALATTNTYTKPLQIIGNYNITASDNFYRDEFTDTVNIKNLRE